eukprot:884930-Rhodomonas_salina.7
MFGTEAGYGATRTRHRIAYASRMPMTRCAIGLRACCAMSGTDLLYGATRRGAQQRIAGY